MVQARSGAVVPQHYMHDCMLSDRSYEHLDLEGGRTLRYRTCLPAGQIRDRVRGLAVRRAVAGDP